MSSAVHIVPEREEILQYIQDSCTTTRSLIRRSGLVERRVQRRINELLDLGWIEQVGSRFHSHSKVRVFGLTEEGRRNVPSGA